MAPHDAPRFRSAAHPDGALLIGNPEEVAEKIMRHSEALGGISRVTFQNERGIAPTREVVGAIELIGTRVAPAVRAKARNRKDRPDCTGLTSSSDLETGNLS